MVQGSTELSHQLVGTEGSPARSETFHSLVKGKNVLLRCDNSTAVKYVNKQGGGGDQVIQSMSFDMGSSSLVQGESHCIESSTYSSKKEYSSRRSVTRENNSSIDRMESESE